MDNCFGSISCLFTAVNWLNLHKMRLHTDNWAFGRGSSNHFEITPVQKCVSIADAGTQRLIEFHWFERRTLRQTVTNLSQWTRSFTFCSHSKCQVLDASRRTRTTQKNWHQQVLFLGLYSFVDGFFSFLFLLSFEENYSTGNFINEEKMFLLCPSNWDNIYLDFFCSVFFFLRLTTSRCDLWKFGSLKRESWWMCCSSGFILIESETTREWFRPENFMLCGFRGFYSIDSFVNEAPKRSVGDWSISNI